jgi:hypothetical protein
MRQAGIAHPLSSRRRILLTAKQVIRSPFILRAAIRDARVARDCEHELAICAIFREEAPFLAEWIDFHRGVGFSHFFLYNNFSTDNFSSVLAPYVETGCVTLKDWPVLAGQLAAYTDCVRTQWRRARWIALIDIDEFLFSPNMVDIRPIIRSYVNFPGLVVWQAFFGSSGHQARPDAPVVEAYTRRGPLSITTAKSIVNPRRVYKAGIHTSRYWSGNAFDTAGRAITPGLAPILDVLRINHYWSRSIEDLVIKVRRGDAALKITRDRDWHFAYEARLNEEDDTSILPIARAIRAGRPVPDPTALQGSFDAQAPASP